MINRSELLDNISGRVSKAIRYKFCGQLSCVAKFYHILLVDKNCGDIVACKALQTFSHDLKKVCFQVPFPIDFSSVV